MNYIKQLQEDNQELKNRITKTQETITELYKYLSLPKFYNSDNMVNVADIFQRLELARQILHTTI